ncbi:MAG TPA: hypothetical protein VKA21_01675 [Candidatus Binatia bacterium]|nr:hypothetical protein [Candidatus Binatia bacterium]
MTRTPTASAVLAAVLLVVAVLGWLGSRSEPTRSTPPPREPPPMPRVVEPAPPASAPARDPEIAESMRQRREERRVERRANAEPRYTLNAPGEHEGIAAFPPPGTKPIKRGLVVPDDFELPPGYVRHYQTTDDGRRLPPILMYHPDFAGVDANGNRIAIPEDRVVPPAMAPPGLPQRTLDETTDVDEGVGRRVHSDTTPPAARR